jgi:hypothetical protein
MVSEEPIVGSYDYNVKLIPAKPLKFNTDGAIEI